MTLLAIGGATPAEASHRGCRIPRGATVEAKTKYAVAYYDTHGREFGCLFSLGRRAELYDVDGDVTLAGRYVAYPQTSYEPDGTVYYLLTVFDLRRRAARSFSSLYQRQPPDFESREGEVAGIAKDLVLKKNGSVAWISCAPIFDTPEKTDCFRDPDIPPEAWRTDRRGTKMLDASADLRLRSLKRRGSTITWRHGAKTRTAQLK